VTHECTPVGPLVYEGQTVITAVLADETGWGIANIDEPTAAEIGDGIDISSYFAKQGGLQKNLSRTWPTPRPSTRSRTPASRSACPATRS
jgi:hypothetical protein